MKSQQTQEGDRLEAGLHIVATPIGNLQDITFRAIDTLKRADLIACEDTRVTGKLLAHYDIRTPTTSYHEHNAAHKRPELLAAMREGKAIALVSDAGTPLISDPGYKLVKEAREQAIPVTALPGASSVLTALCVSGLPSDKFLFLGFLPPKQGAKRSLLSAYNVLPVTLIIFETGPRLFESLRSLRDILGDRHVTVARELTKFFEETRHGTFSELLASYEGQENPKGEIVLIIGPADVQHVSDEMIDTLLAEALAKESIRDASARLADELGIAKARIYQRALALKNP